MSSGFLNSSNTASNTASSILNTDPDMEGVQMTDDNNILFNNNQQQVQPQYNNQQMNRYSIEHPQGILFITKKIRKKL